MELDNERAREIIDRLGNLTDLSGWEVYILEQTYGGREPAPEPWELTREFMQDKGNAASADELIRLFEQLGCTNEVAAIRWMLDHDELTS